MIVIIDNYDSFVHNIARYVALLGVETRVIRNDAIDVAGLRALQPRALILSPGPKTPREAGVTLPAIRSLSGECPLLGICLGHQAIGEAFGGRTLRAQRPLHGHATPIRHCDTRLFAGLAQPMTVGRYHSLIVGADEVSSLLVDAVSSEGEIMALSHPEHPTFGVQFHPESVLTADGMGIFQNFLRLCDAHRRSAKRHALA